MLRMVRNSPGLLGKNSFPDDPFCFGCGGGRAEETPAPGQPLGEEGCATGNRQEARPPWQLHIIQAVMVEALSRLQRAAGALDSGSRPLTLKFTLTPSIWLVLGV